MKIRPKQRCTARGSKVDAADAPSHAPTEVKLADGQLADHYVLCAEERAKGFVEPVRHKYVHSRCGVVTSMPTSIAETYARDPYYYGSTFCCGCGAYFRVGENGEFVWDGTTQKVGTRSATA